MLAVYSPRAGMNRASTHVMTTSTRVRDEPYTLYEKRQIYSRVRDVYTLVCSTPRVRDEP